MSAKVVNSHFAVTVMDTGPGIPEQEQARIFEQFHQVDSSLAKAKGGTGLGLAIAREIVEMHDGRIWIESTLGQGSTSWSCQCVPQPSPVQHEQTHSCRGGPGGSASPPPVTP